MSSINSSSSKPRIAMAGINHETNTYCRGLTETKDFFQVRGERMLRAKGRHTGMGGALVACEALGFEPVPILFVTAQPSGTICRETYEVFKQEILDGLQREAPLDGVYLDLHGAGVVEGIPDMEADLTTSIRDLIGDDTPMTASFDLHGNVSQVMADALDGVFACHHYPHIDFHLRAEEAIQLIADMIANGTKPQIHLESVPMLMPCTTTFEGIGQDTINAILELEKQEGIIDISWFHGFPYTDVPQVSCHLMVTAKSDRQLAQHVAIEAADLVWQRREEFRPVSLSAEAAVETALGHIQASDGTKPVVINENSDNCGGGAPGDGTHLLRALLDFNRDGKLGKTCFAFVVDAEVAELAHQQGVGSTINISLGGKYDDLHGAPLEVNAYVKALHDGRIVMKAMAKGTPLNLGKLVRLVVDGIDIVVGSARSQTFDVGPFEAVGINVLEYSIVALKSSNHFRAGFGDLAECIVTADPPGLTTHHIEVFERDHKPGPMWPLDADARYPK